MEVKMAIAPSILNLFEFHELKYFSRQDVTPCSIGILITRGTQESRYIRGLNRYSGTKSGDPGCPGIPVRLATLLKDDVKASNVRGNHWRICRIKEKRRRRRREHLFPKSRNQVKE
ncbi:unnamed protein product [Nesidiocoris tenuis]|uniref:Uncharacterized protein n=1 Tax=Nesidiocoris tenuis TaxID=355587 RepID=A0A6H5H7C4_9HEMI|nr:unnamed protein product [Nesidiocoris tenuis]